MILMYHHVCPVEKVPPDSAPLEGWAYNITPNAFERQLCNLIERGFQFVSMAKYIDMLTQSRLNYKTVTVTFDDGWKDNFEFALPILVELNIPATIFAVSGEMKGVDKSRRMSTRELLQLNGYSISVGAHTITHPNLTLINEQQLRRELSVSKLDLENLLGQEVHYLAYPGGRFNSRVVAATKEAGYDAACSVIGWGQNTPESRYWLFRDVLSSDMRGASDRLRLNFWTRRLLSGRGRRALASMMAD